MVDPGLIPGLGRSPGKGNFSNPLQYSCLENSMDRRAWWATVHGVAQELDTTEWRIYIYIYTHTYIYIYGLLRLQGFNSVKSILLFLFSFSVWINLNPTILVVGEFHIQTLDSYILSTCMVSVSNISFLSKIVSAEPRVTAWHARGRICSSWTTAVLQVKCLEHLPQKQMVGL